ncbi:hypothetical protein FIBSPDRAFT_867951 [Athelia psychrophila]|uniref:Uncharacterized protein n=1 Tax=Athelia psychrophila TaxID=1759441 RepID=A0A166DKF7_9AGAM|nr:hypothetical protein FIBSPDRAFT_867951 [Fibularhizoctonia sp. CBS 109695]
MDKSDGDARRSYGSSFIQGGTLRVLTLGKSEGTIAMPMSYLDALRRVSAHSPAVSLPPTPSLTAHSDAGATRAEG